MTAGDPEDQVPTDPGSSPTAPSQVGVTRVSLVAASDAPPSGGAAPPPVDPNTQLGNSWIGRVIDDFRVLRVLGAGGMGVVFLAEQRNPQRLVALKTLHASGLQNPELRARFHQEAEILGRLKHPAIAQIFASGHAPHALGGMPYIVMEYVDGLPLLDYSNDKPLPEQISLLREICAGVAHAHVRGVIHRDLKPGNILVQPDGIPKILDFGVARLSNDDSGGNDLTTAGVVVGTIAYMSPEQAVGDPAGVDIRTDLYALGMIGYRMLCGEPPYRIAGQNLAQAIEDILHTEPTPLSRYLRDCPKDLETIFRKALCKEKEARYQNANELSEDLRRFLADEAILATRPSVITEIRRFSRRNKVLVASAVSVLLMLIAAVAVSTSFAVREQQQRLQSDTMVTFMRNLFSSANPVFARGREVSVRDVLDQSRNTLNDTLQDAPIARARMRTTIAETYRALGDLQVALAQYQLAQDDYRDAGLRDIEALLAYLGEQRILIDSGRVLEASQSLSARFANSGADALRASLLEVYWAVALSALGDHAQARTHFAALPQLRTLRCATCPPEYLTRTWLWAALLEVENALATGEYAVATSKLDALSSDALMPLDASDPDVLRIRVLQARLLAASGDMGGAQALLDQIYADRLHLLGAGHWQTVSAANDRALLSQERGDLDAAQELFVAAIEAASELDPGNPTRNVVQSNFGQLLYLQGDAQGGLQWLQEAYLQQVQRLGPSHPSTLQTAQSLALVHSKLGQFEQAEPLIVAAMEGTITRFGAEHRRSLAVRSEYAAYLRDRGRYATADALFAEVLAQVQQQFPAGDDDRLRVLYQYSGSLQRQQQFAQAFTLSAQLVQEAALGNQESPYALLAPLRHARSLMGLGRYALAEPLLLALQQRLAVEGSAQMRAMTEATLAELAQAKNRAN